MVVMRRSIGGRGRGCFPGQATQDIAQQDRPTQYDPRMLPHLVEEISRGVHALDRLIHGQLDTVDDRVGRDLAPATISWTCLNPAIA